jgi:uncharacterized protein (TIGR02118 family)
VLLQRAEGVGVETFRERWIGEHLPMAEGLPGVRAVRFLPAVQGLEAFPVAFEGLGLLTFESVEAALGAFSSEAGRALRAHTATFAASDRAVRQFYRDPEGC